MTTKIEPNDTNTDSSPYIRTFAKDFAVLAAKDPEGAAHAKDKRPRPKPAPLSNEQLPSKKPVKGRIDDQPIKEFDPGDLSKINIDTGEISNEHPQDIPNEAYEKEPAAEVLELPKLKDGDIIESINSNKGLVKTPKAATSGEPTDAERAAILARLKARASSVTSTPAETPAPTITPATKQVQKFEVVTPESVPVATTIPVPVETPKLPEQHSEKPAPDIASPIHTYTSDFADQIDSKGASTFSVLAAEKDAPVRRPAQQPKRKAFPILPIFTAVILILIGAGGVYFAYTFMQKTAPIAIISAPNTLIPYDSKIQLAGTRDTLLSNLAEVASRPLALNSILYIYANSTATSTQNMGNDTVSQLNLRAPTILLRNIDPSSMVGALNTNGQTRAFFIFRVTSYERTFAGMLQWEPSLQQNLSILFPLYPKPKVQLPQLSTLISTSTPTASTTNKTFPLRTATSTVNIPIAPTIDTSVPQSQFTDEIVANRSVRALKDISGRTIVLYGYADKATLILVRDEDAFTFIVNRLSVGAS